MGFRLVATIGTAFIVPKPRNDASTVKPVSTRQIDHFLVFEVGHAYGARLIQGLFHAFTLYSHAILKAALQRGMHHPIDKVMYIRLKIFL